MEAAKRHFMCNARNGRLDRSRKTRRISKPSGSLETTAIYLEVEGKKNGNWQNGCGKSEYLLYVTLIYSIKILLLAFDALPSKGKGKQMKEPGLDNRHRDQNPPKAGEIDQKHGNTLNKHLPVPIPQFPPNMTLEEMRQRTGKTSIEKVREAAKSLQ